MVDHDIEAEDVTVSEPGAPEMPDSVPTEAEKLLQAPSAWSQLSRRWPVGVLLCALAWLVGRITVGIRWGLSRSLFSANPHVWYYQDTFKYTAIAKWGNTFGRCGTKAFPWNPIERYAGLVWCGRSGWLPGYPEAIKLVHGLGVYTYSAALSVAWVALFGVLVLVWLGWGRDVAPLRCFGMLCLVAVFPGAVFAYGESPMALALFFVFAALILAGSRRHFWAACSITVAGLCYPAVWFAAGGLMVGYAIVAGPLGIREIGRRVGWGLAGLVTPIVILGTYDQLTVSKFNAYWLDDYTADVGRSWNPFSNFSQLVIHHDSITQLLLTRFYAEALGWQSLLAMLMIVVVAVLCVLAWRHGEADGWVIYPALASAAVIGCLLFTSTSGAWTRGVWVAVPSAVVLKRLPTPLLWCVVVLAGAATLAISKAYFNGTLV